MQNPYITPATELECQIADVWKKALGVEEVGINDNFFELGGDSMIAIQVASQLRKELDVDLQAANLYQSLTINSLAKLIKDKQEQSPAE